MHDAPTPEQRRLASELLLGVLCEAQGQGFLGPGSVEAALDHALHFVPPVPAAGRILDLGSGGGLPGLVVAAACPGARLTLLDSSQRRTDWLRRVVLRLGWSERVVVVTGPAEVLGHDAQWRASQDAVVARSFAVPLVTAECASAFLATGGRLVVSEPPAPEADRWPSDRLGELGLARLDWPDDTVAIFEQRRACPPAVPRGSIVRGNTA